MPKKIKRLTIVIERLSNSQHVLVNGCIDETVGSELDGVASHIDSPVTFNLRHVEQLNSAGIRVWCSMIRRITGKVTVTYEECSQTFVYHLSLTPFLSAGVTLTSGYLPFFCDKCGDEVPVLIRLRHDLAEQTEGRPCPKCKSALQLHGEATRFLLFKLKGGSTPPDAGRL